MRQHRKSCMVRLWEWLRHVLHVSRALCMKSSVEDKIENNIASRFRRKTISKRRGSDEM